VAADEDYSGYVKCDAKLAIALKSSAPNGRGVASILRHTGSPGA
jgi:hypothetical protein